MLPIGEQFINKAKHRLKAGEKLIGAWAQLCNSMSVEIMARSGFDFLVIDMEHAPGDYLTLLSQLQAIGKYDTMPAVRIHWNDFITIKKILDLGVHCVHVPYVNTALEAEAAVKATRYAPEGIRGIAGSPRACGYGISGKDYFEHANRELLVYIALETPESITSLDDILKVDGVDGIFIGPMDLATSMGYLGNPQHPAVQSKIREIEEKVLHSGKFLGTVAANYEVAQELYDRGYQYIIAMSDSVELSKQSLKLVSDFKSQY